MFDIVLIENGNDSGTIVQYAHTIEQANNLIANVLPKTKPGYSYQTMMKPVPTITPPR